MSGNSRLQMLAVLAVGAVGGWLAASGRLTGPPRSDAAPPPQAESAKADGSCCNGADRGLMLAKADAPLPGSGGGAGQPSAPANGKKPNILFIMGDDIGWMQPGCYHRGLMVGETPTSTASRGRARSSWTTSPCRAAPPGATPSSPACTRCAPE